jgi:pyruvate dehydrogenase E2 component (dihydrolipoamide acetyltransferase)
MATPVELPKSGNTVEECVISRWVKKEGDVVSAGDVVAEVETDKATFEITAPVAGTVLAIFFSEGALVPVFTTVCVIGAAGEDVEPFRPGAVVPVPSPQSPVPTAQATLSASPEPRTPIAVSASPEPRAPTARASMHLSPRARKFAAERSFEPAAIIGSGPGGRILEQDVRKAYESAAAPASFPRPSATREVIARRLRESPATTAHYTLHTTADARQLLSMRARAKEAARVGRTPDISINALVTFCTVRALLDTPDLNAELVDGAIVRYQSIHLGFACDTPRGLLVPVVRDAQDLSIGRLARRMNELAASAVDGSISPDALSGGTFTITNLRSLGVEWLTPVIIPPQVAILGVGAIEVKPVRTDGRIEFIDAIALSLTCDHQAIDGAPGARFLRTLAEKIEHIEADMFLRGF